MHRDIFAALAEPFPPQEVKNRQGGRGRTLYYITARQAMNRLDEVVGPENWRNSHRVEQLADGVSVAFCRIEIRIDGEWIAKEDAGGFKVMMEREVRDDENTAKTGPSDAFKRAASLWGIGRYLYNDGVADFDDDPAPAREPRSNHPESPDSPPPRQRPTPATDPLPPMKGGTPYGNKPTSGSGLFAWLKDQGERYDVDAVRHVMDWSRDHAGNARIKDLEASQVEAAHAVAVAFIEERGLGKPPADPAPPPSAELPDSIPLPGNREVRRPADGKDLYRAIVAVQDAHGVAINDMIRKAARERGVRDQMVEWGPADVAIGWATLCMVHDREVAKSSLPPSLDPLAVEVNRKARELVALIHGIEPNRVERADVGAKVREVYGSLWPGENVPVSTGDIPLARLPELVACLDDYIAEAADVPAGI